MIDTLIGFLRTISNNSARAASMPENFPTISLSISSLFLMVKETYILITVPCKNLWRAQSEISLSCSWPSKLASWSSSRASKYTQSVPRKAYYLSPPKWRGNPSSKEMHSMRTLSLRGRTPAQAALSHHYHQQTNLFILDIFGIEINIIPLAKQLSWLLLLFQVSIFTLGRSSPTFLFRTQFSLPQWLGFCLIW